MQVAQVAVDTVTYSAEVEEFWSVQEVGRVLHPVLAGGQIEGGIAQGIGYALYEKVVWQNGHMANNQMTNYIMPTAEDVPPIHIYFEEIPFAHGAFGAKGIGELPHDGPAPAILNAIRDATGVGFNSIPLLPEDLFAKLWSSRRHRGARRRMSANWPAIRMTVNGIEREVHVAAHEAAARCVARRPSPDRNQGRLRRRRMRLVLRAHERRTGE